MTPLRQRVAREGAEIERYIEKQLAAELLVVAPSDVARRLLARARILSGLEPMLAGEVVNRARALDPILVARAEVA